MLPNCHGWKGQWSFRIQYISRDQILAKTNELKYSLPGAEISTSSAHSTSAHASKWAHLLERTVFWKWGALLEEKQTKTRSKKGANIEDIHVTGNLKTASIIHFDHSLCQTHRESLERCLSFSPHWSCILDICYSAPGYSEYIGGCAKVKRDGQAYIPHTSAPPQTSSCPPNLSARGNRNSASVDMGWLNHQKGMTVGPVYRGGVHPLSQCTVVAFTLWVSVQ